MKVKPDSNFLRFLAGLIMNSQGLNILSVSSNQLHFVEKKSEKNLL